MPNYVYNVSNLQLKQNTYTNTSINSINLRNIPWQSNSMVNSFFNCIDLTKVENINSNVTNMSNTFRNCVNLVNIQTLPSAVTNLSYTFYDCHELVEVPTIPNSVTNLVGTFYNCRLINEAPSIPNSISDLSYTFMGCASLRNAPTIPNSVTNMFSTFIGCSSLDNVPQLSNSIIDLSRTFVNCTNLVNAPNIPDSVMNMASVFENCKNLTGDIYVYSNQILNANQSFNNTSAIKNVYIPFYNLYSNRAEAITYSAFNTAGYDDAGTQDGVYLKNLTPVIALNVTPADATVTLEAGSYSTSDKTIAVLMNTNVNWTVSKEGYITQQNTELVDIDKTINVELIEKTVRITITPVPNTALVTLEADGYPTVEGYGEQYIIVRPDTLVTYDIDAVGYNPVLDTVASDVDLALTVELKLAQEYNFTVNDYDQSTLIEYLGIGEEVVIPDYVQGIATSEDKDAGELDDTVTVIENAGNINDSINDIRDAGLI